MRTIYLSIVRRIVLFVFLIVILPNQGRPGSYNRYSNLGYCTDTSTCLHEIGHAIDDKSGRISQSEDFKLAVAIYLNTADLSEWRSARLYNQITYTLFTTKQNPMAEVYAWFFAYSGGNLDNLPSIIRPFFDQSLVRECLKQNGNHIMWFL